MYQNMLQINTSLFYNQSFSGLESHEKHTIQELEKMNSSKAKVKDFQFFLFIR